MRRSRVDLGFVVFFAPLIGLAPGVTSAQETPAEESLDAHPAPGSTYVTVAADRLELDLETGTARGEGLRLSACGTCAPPWTVTARRAVLRSNGDIDLVLPVLRLGRVPVFALPWLRAHTARRWGLLLPRLGARSGGGFEVGQGVWLPLGSRYELEVSAAYLTELVGAEVDVELSGDDVELRVLGQVGANGYGALVDGRLSYSSADRRRGSVSHSTSVAAQLEWTLDPELARQLSTSVEEEARSYEVSSLAVIGATRHVQAALTTELLHGLAMRRPDFSYMPLTELSFDVFPVRLGPFWMSLRQSTRAMWAIAPGAGELWASWRTVLEPRLSGSFVLGPVATRVTAASVLSAWPRTIHDRSADNRGLVVAGVDLSVPLVKTSGRSGTRRRQLVEPAVRYRFVMVDTQLSDGLRFPPSSELFDPLTWPVAGNTLWLALRTASTSPRTGHGVRAELGQMLSFDGLAGSRVPPRLEGRIELDAGLAEVWLTVSLDERDWAVGEAWSRALIGHEDGHGVELDWRWLREGSNSQSGPDMRAVVPRLVPWGALVGGHTLGGRLWTTFGGVLQLEAEAWADLERRSLVVVGGGLSYSHRCGCLSAALRAWYRPWRQWPDVLVTVNLGGLGGS